MSPSADEALLAALGAVARTFRELGAPAMIIGGVAVIARGVPRQTIDVDSIVGDIAAVLDEPDRLAEFEVIVRRVKEATREEPT